jgi:hypothetical protein
MIPRELVLVVGDEQIEATPFTERRLTIRSATEAEALGLFRVARAIIIAEPPGKFEKITAYFGSLLRRAEEHELLLAVMVHSEKDYLQVQAIQKSASVGTAVLFYPHQLVPTAESIARAYVGPQQANEAIIDPPYPDLSAEEEVLLRRAFYDCTRVCLEPLTEGKGSTNVLRVHAWIKGSEVGPRPLPFFAKFSDPVKIRSERHNYQNYAELYVPFNLRPNLNRKRCVRGHRSAALVGNFVEDAIPLRTALRHNTAGAAIFSLFERTLRGFRIQPFVEGKKQSRLEYFVRSRTKADEILPEISDRAELLGLKTSPKTLEDKICVQAQGILTWSGPIHGDLHHGNIMVRHSDAIIIDFASVSHGPLTADPATLEASLVFGTDKEDKLWDLEKWFSFVRDAYGSVPLVRPPKPEAEPGTYSWLRQSVREIRHVLFGCDCVDKEAALILACYLMRFARLSLETFIDPDTTELARWRHAYALVIAEQIVDSVS